MPEIALHTRLRPESVADYEAVHRSVPADLLAALQAAGVRNWRIWRDGTDLFHLVDVEDYAAMRNALRDHPANVAWQARVVPLHETPDDYSGTDAGLPLLWSFADQAAAQAVTPAQVDAGADAPRVGDTRRGSANRITP